MVSVGLDIRGDQVACARVESIGTRGILRAAEVLNVDDLSSIAIGSRAIMLAKAEWCYRKRQQLPHDIKIPNLRNYAAIAQADSDRPGGTKRAAAAEQRGRDVCVALVNLDNATSAREDIQPHIGCDIGVSDPVAAWLALKTAGIDLPEVIIDDWADPAQVLVLDPQGSWIFSDIEPIPPADRSERSTSISQRASTTVKIVKSILTHRTVRHVGVTGRLAQPSEIDFLIAGLASDVETIEPIPNAQPWWPAFGAALVPLVHLGGIPYEEVAS